MDALRLVGEGLTRSRILQNTECIFQKQNWFQQNLPTPRALSAHPYQEVNTCPLFDSGQSITALLASLLTQRTWQRGPWILRPDQENPKLLPSSPGTFFLVFLGTFRTHHLCCKKPKSRGETTCWWQESPLSWSVSHPGPGAILEVDPPATSHLRHFRQFKSFLLRPQIMEEWRQGWPTVPCLNFRSTESRSTIKWVLWWH